VFDNAKTVCSKLKGIVRNKKLDEYEEEIYIDFTGFHSNVWNCLCSE
jgi:hypothetical protein